MYAVCFAHGCCMQRACFCIVCSLRSPCKRTRMCMSQNLRHYRSYADAMLPQVPQKPTACPTRPRPLRRGGLRRPHTPKAAPQEAHPGSAAGVGPARLAMAHTPRPAHLRACAGIIVDHWVGHPSQPFGKCNCLLGNHLCMKWHGGGPPRVGVAWRPVFFFKVR